MGKVIFQPQPGPQEAFLACSADICIYGGAAGGGKTYSLLMAPLRYKDVQRFGAVMFRRNFNQIFAEGGMWDEASNMYRGIRGAIRVNSRSKWMFCDKNGRKVSQVSFAHIDRDDGVHAWQGSQIAMIGFDELCHFSEHVFFYMLSRNRSTCGVKPFIRATCNPDADSWVAKFIAWWINQESGYPIPERSGVIRWMLRRDNKIHWADTQEELWEQFDLKSSEERAEPKSVTFIASSVYDNKILLKNDPGYLANLKAMSIVEKERLLYGNWKIKASGGLFFQRSQVDVIDAAPANMQFVCRAWDLAATGDKESGDPDYTSGVLMGVRKDRTVVVLDVINVRVKAGEVGKLVYNTAVVDRKKYGFRYKVRIPQDPGAAGKIVASSYVKKLAGFSVKAMPVSGSKQLRATPFAAQWQNGNVAVMAGEWNDVYFTQLESFPESKHDDMVDASSDAFNELTASNFILNNLL